MARDIFADLDFDWQPVSPKLAMCYRITRLSRFILPAVSTIVANSILHTVELPKIAPLVIVLAIPSSIVASIPHWIYAGLRSAS